MRSLVSKLISIVAFYKVKAVAVLFRQLVFVILQKFSKKNSILTNVYDYQMLLPLKDDGIGQVLFVLGERELDHKWLIDNEVRPDDKVLDLGANIGYYAIMEAMKLSEAGHVYAIEPDPRNTHFFEQNMILNNLSDKVDFQQGAISNHNGKATFGLHKRTNLNSFNFTKNKSNSDIHEVQVDVIDFGDYIKGLGGVDLVRMDVEGHEFEIFQSLVNLLSSDKKLAPRTIIFETHCYKSPNLMRKIMHQLFEFGYKAKYITSDDELGSDNAIIAQSGYIPNFVISEWGVSRGIYQDIKSVDAAELISNWEGTRTVCLEYVQ